MGEITHKRRGELMLKLFDILKQYPDGLNVNIALEKMAQSTEMTPFEKSNYASGERRFENIVRWSTVSCVKAGWLAKQRGIWSVTESGLNVAQKFRDPEDFSREQVRMYKEWHTQNLNQTETSEEPLENDDIPENTSITFEKAEAQAWEEVEKFLKTMPPYEFQELVADLLRAMGYFVSWVAPPGKDGGVDIIAHPDPLGTQSPRLKVQVKRHAEARADRPTVQSFISTINDNDAGLFICTSGFSKDAEEYARSQERRKIMLVDLERFFDLWVQFHGKLSDAARRRFPITPIHFLTPED